jgi:hypothetical protein
MKYIKTYHLFESNLSQYFEADVIKKSEEVIADIKDILLELSDIGYQVNIDYAPFLRQYLSYDSPVIRIIIQRPSGDSVNPLLGGVQRFLPLWNSEESKMQFDDVILRVLRYSSSEGYKYEYEGAKSAAGDIKGQIVRYTINIYKEN